MASHRIGEQIAPEDGYVFLVKYAHYTDKAMFYKFYAASFTEFADRFRFSDARLARSYTPDVERSEHAVELPNDPELDKKKHEIFTYQVRKPTWFDKKEAVRVEPEGEIDTSSSEPSNERQAAGMAFDPVTEALSSV